jgi:signal transduction histidine kinase/ActR/RegA family two-component response regulator
VERNRAQILNEGLSNQIKRRETLSKAANIAFFEFDLDRQTVDGDETLQSRYGRPASAGEFAISDYPWKYGNEAWETISQAIAFALEQPAGVPIDITYKEFLPDGESIYVRTIGQRVIFEGRNLFFGAAIDITDLESARHQSMLRTEMLDFVSNAGGIAFFEVNFESMTIQGNDLLYERDGLPKDTGAYSMEKILGNVPESARLQMQADIAQAMQRPEGETYSFNHPYIRHDGKLIEVRVTATNRIKEGVLWAYGASVDVTDEIETQRQIQQQLALINEQSQKQTQMFSIIGHELRTPLSSMKMMEEAMDLRNIGEYGANICESTDAVLNIVDDLRTVINPDKAHQAQAVVDSPFDVLSRTTRSLEGLYEQQGVEVVVSSNQLSHSLCKFNAQALRQKITNLTKNAAIHADADKVWVDLQAQPRGDDKIDLTLIVEDDGKGIPEGLREAVFGAFSRGDTRADGTGLGLYITRELAEKLGGTVEYFESEKGGAGFRVEFTLDLHLDAIGHEQELNESVIPVALQGKRILFAEDQKTLQLLTSKLLKDAGAEVVVCDNGKQALEAFRAGEFDIVLTDLMMPEMSGDELIRHVRADGFTGQVVALTAAIIGKETDVLLEAGADAVLNKPLDIHEMKRTIAVLENKVSAA